MSYRTGSMFSVVFLYWTFFEQASLRAISRPQKRKHPNSTLSDSITSTSPYYSNAFHARMTECSLSPVSKIDCRNSQLFPKPTTCINCSICIGPASVSTSGTLRVGVQWFESIQNIALGAGICDKWESPLSPDPRS